MTLTVLVGGETQLGKCEEETSSDVCWSRLPVGRRCVCVCVIITVCVCVCVCNYYRPSVCVFGDWMLLFRLACPRMGRGAFTIFPIILELYRLADGDPIQTLRSEVTGSSSELRIMTAGLKVYKHPYSATFGTMKKS